MPGAGHLLPETLVLAEDATLSGHGVAGAGFEVRPDPETEFPLFRATGGAAGPAAVATLAPGVDLTEGIEAFENERFERERTIAPTISRSSAR